MKLKSKVFLAPMEEINDPAFRILCKTAGAGLTWTPLLSPLSKQKLVLKDKPILQIFGTNVRGIREFMKKHDGKVSGWDFNLGCPATNAKRKGFGAYFDNLEKIEEIIQLMRSNTKKSLCVKIRKSPISFEILKIAEKYCDWIAIHPRTKEQGYSGEPDLKWAKDFKRSSKIPVIYSGNVDETNYEKYLKIFDYVMIGRKAIGRPEIFSNISGKRYSKTFRDYLKLAKKFGVPWRVVKFQAMQFTKGEKDAKKQRLKIYGIKNLEELERIIL